MIEQGKVLSYSAFVNRLHKAEIDGLINYGSLEDTSTESDWIRVLDEGYAELEEKDKIKNDLSANVNVPKNPYIINFRRINADSRSEFYGAVDVRNIESIEYGEQKIRKD